MLVMYVMFRDAPSQAWYRNILRAGFGHCSVLVQDKDKWILVEGIAKWLNVQVYSDKVIESFLQEMSQHRTIVKVQIKQLNYRGWRIWPFTCTTIAQYVLGKNLWCITPYGLYKKLTGKYKTKFNTELYEEREL